MKKWVVKNKIDRNLYICNNNLISNLLLSRGIENKQAAEEFLYPSIDRLYNPFLLKDMDRAVERIDAAVKAREKITIYGDYDVDGITSTSILYRAFKKLGVDVGYYIPDRMNEGYGINDEALKYLKILATDLIITVDCGVTSVEEVEYAKSLGMDIIVTDHHVCKEIIPDTIVVNPKRNDCSYPFKYLSGCGIAFKLVQALWIHYGLSGYDDFLDIAAIGTVADVVDLVDENRIIVKNGLELMKNSEKCGIRAIKNVSAIDGDVTAYNVGFQISPRINAAGRLSDAKIAVELFTTNDYDKALQIAKYLDQENRKRQEIEEQICNECIEKINAEVDVKRDRVIILSSPNWHVGVVGIVASRLVERYNRPVLLLCEEGEIGRGSGRSIEGFNLFENLYACRNLMVKFGGHELAAGVTMKILEIDSLREEMNRLASNYDPEIFQEKLFIDMKVDAEDVNLNTAELINKLQPFGYGNPSPVFSMEGLSIVNKWGIGSKKQHLKLSFERDGYKYNSVFFNASDSFISKDWDCVDIAFNMDINNWNNVKSLQLILKDMRPNCNWIKSSILDGYYRGLRYIVSDKIGEYDFKGVNFIEKDINFLKEFIYLKKGYILVNSYKSLTEIESIIDSTEISINNNIGMGVQIIVCPKIDEINFNSASVLIYDFLPGEYEYSLLTSMVKNSIYNFYDIETYRKIKEFLNDIILSEAVVYKFWGDLRYNEIIGSIQDISKKYNINPYKIYSMIMLLREKNLINIYMKNDLLKVEHAKNYDDIHIDLSFQNAYINKLINLENKFKMLLGEE